MEIFKFLLLISVIHISYVKTSCDILKTQLDKENTNTNIEEFIKTNIGKIAIDYQPCLTYLLHSGQYNYLEVLLNELLTHGIKFKKELNKIIQDYFSYLREFKSKFDYIETDYQIVRPAVKWAQSKEYVMIEVKYSHRHDAPGCSDTEEESFELPSTSEAWFQAYCMQGDTPIKFQLNINLFSDVVKLQSSWGSGGSGKFKITLRKQSPEYWERLLKEEEQPQNMQKWFEMESEYEKQMEKELQEKEEEKFDEEIKEMEKKQKKNRRKTEWNGLAFGGGQ